MKRTIQTALLAAAVVAGFCLADSSSAKAYGPYFRPRLVPRVVTPVRTTVRAVGYTATVPVAAARRVVTAPYRVMRPVMPLRPVVPVPLLCQRPSICIDSARRRQLPDSV